MTWAAYHIVTVGVLCSVKQVIRKTATLSLFATWENFDSYMVLAMEVRTKKLFIGVENCLI